MMRSSPIPIRGAYGARRLRCGWLTIAVVLVFAVASITRAHAGDHDHPARTPPTMPDGTTPPPVVERLWNDLVCLCGRCERLTLAACACEQAAAERRNIVELVAGHELATPRDERAAYDRVIDSYVKRFGQRVLATDRDRERGSGSARWWLAPVGLLAVITVGYLLLLWWGRERVPRAGAQKRPRGTKRRRRK